MKKIKFTEMEDIHSSLNTITNQLQDELLNVRDVNRSLQNQLLASLENNKKMNDIHCDDTNHSNDNKNIDILRKSENINVLALELKKRTREKLIIEQQYELKCKQIDELENKDKKRLHQIEILQKSFDFSTQRNQKIWTELQNAMKLIEEKSKEIELLLQNNQIYGSIDARVSGKILEEKILCTLNDLQNEMDQHKKNVSTDIKQINRKSRDSMKLIKQIDNELLNTITPKPWIDISSTMTTSTSSEPQTEEISINIKSRTDGSKSLFVKDSGQKLKKTEGDKHTVRAISFSGIIPMNVNDATETEITETEITNDGTDTMIGLQKENTKMIETMNDILIKQTKEIEQARRNTIQSLYIDQLEDKLSSTVNELKHVQQHFENIKYKDKEYKDKDKLISDLQIEIRLLKLQIKNGNKSSLSLNGSTTTTIHKLAEKYTDKCQQLNVITQQLNDLRQSITINPNHQRSLSLIMKQSPQIQTKNNRGKSKSIMSKSYAISIPQIEENKTNDWRKNQDNNNRSKSLFINTTSSSSNFLKNRPKSQSIMSPLTENKYIEILDIDDFNEQYPNNNNNNIQRTNSLFIAPNTPKSAPNIQKEKEKRSKSFITKSYEKIGEIYNFNVEDEITGLLLTIADLKTKLSQNDKLLITNGKELELIKNEGNDLKNIINKLRLEMDEIEKNKKKLEQELADLKLENDKFCRNSETLKFVNECQTNTIKRIMNNFRYMNMENKIEIQQQLNGFNHYLNEMENKLKQKCFTNKQNLKVLNKEIQFLENENQRLMLKNEELHDMLQNAENYQNAINYDLRDFRIDCYQNLKITKSDNSEIKLQLNKFNDFILEINEIIIQRLKKNKQEKYVKYTYLVGLEDKLKINELELFNVNRENDNLQNELDSMDKELNDLQTKNTSLHSEMNKLQTKITNISDLNDQKDRVIKQLENEMNDKHQKNKYWMELYQTVYDENENLKQQQKELQTDLDEIKNKLKKEEEYSLSLEKSLDEIGDKNEKIVEELINENERENKKYIKLNEEIIKLKDEYKKLLVSQEKLNEDNQQFLDEIDYLTNELSNGNKKIVKFTQCMMNIEDKKYSIKPIIRDITNGIKNDLNNFNSFLFKSKEELKLKIKGKLILIEGDIIGGSKNKNDILKKFKWKLLDLQTQIKFLEARNKMNSSQNNENKQLEKKNKKLNEKLEKLKKRANAHSEQLKLMPKYLYHVVLAMKKEINTIKKEAKICSKEMQYFNNDNIKKIVNFIQRQQSQIQYNHNDDDNEDYYDSMVSTQSQGSRYSLENIENFKKWMNSFQQELTRLDDISSNLCNETTDLQYLAKSALSDNRFDKNKYNAIINHLYKCLINLQNMTIQIKNDFDEYHGEMNEYGDILQNKLNYKLNGDSVSLPISFVDGLASKITENGILINKMDKSQVKLLTNLLHYTQQIVSTTIKIEVQNIDNDNDNDKIPKMTKLTKMTSDKSSYNETQSFSNSFQQNLSSNDNDDSDDNNNNNNNQSQQQQFSNQTAKELHKQISNSFNMNTPQILRIARLISNNLNIFKASDLEIPLKNDTNNNNILHKTADLGSIVLMEHLLKFKQINPNLQNKNGDAVLHILCQNANKNKKYVEIFRMFINNQWSQNIQYNVINNANKTALELITNDKIKEEIMKSLQQKN